ncbi:hypothetical protein EPUS_00969 [Endocarpon pusillum Z07020]|uniref:Uncharacterized protein n=1 Tax=Endocarpon pusillum (strain Z07020 / HMAS-L-300199) TaxID=1263415 RepID=U1HT35_ENDPU|nr:uncharacterized protein EPUS_00969 [Endocarpon pusillum Z07020]ERF73715.1 hypothetical protein EPUS_00969 [Endocarpon pusillum Z07020]
MLGPPRSPQRLPPPPSPSRSLKGMEKAVPPETRSSSRSPCSPAADINKPLPPPASSARISPFSLVPSSRTSPFSPAADKDKPLPECPRRSSSVYSADSGYNGNVDSYSAHSHEQEQPRPLVIQPIAYKETISALLRRRLEDPPSPKSIPSEKSVGTLASQTWPQSDLVSPEWPTMSGITAPSVADSRSAPSFKEFSTNLRNKRQHVVEATPLPRTSSPPPQASSDFRAVSYESTRWTPEISPRTSDVIDGSLVPAPLAVGRNRDTVREVVRITNDLEPPVGEERSQSRFSSSSDDFVIYTGVKESVIAYVRQKMQNKRDSSKKERKRVMSAASAKYPGMMTAKEYDRKHSTVSRKSSVQQGFSSVYDKISKLSMSSGQSKEEEQQPRGRKKQLAIPTSAYQKYGAAVWEAPKRGKKPKRSSAPAKTLTKKDKDGQAQRHPSISISPTEVIGAFKNGRKQMIHVLDDTKHRLKRSESEKRRDALKQSIKLVGPADHVWNGG